MCSSNKSDGSLKYFFALFAALFAGWAVDLDEIELALIYYVFGGIFKLLLFLTNYIRLIKAKYLYNCS